VQIKCYLLDKSLNLYFFIALKYSHKIWNIFLVAENNVLSIEKGLSFL
jgi:hypothetical protein